MMNSKTEGVMKLVDIVPNPNNPRTIKSVQLTNLKKSIMEFPEMLSLRPLVIDENNIVIGGNMRLRALKELNYTEVPYIQVTGLTDEQKKEFVIKDNLNYGDWNWDSIQFEWDLNDISDWGLDVPEWVMDDDKEPEIDKDVLSDALNHYINASVKKISLFFDTQEYESVTRRLEKISTEQKLDSNTEAFLFLLDFYIMNKTEDHL